jgi:hypothetical protein
MTSSRSGARAGSPVGGPSSRVGPCGWPGGHVQGLVGPLVVIGVQPVVDRGLGSGEERAFETVRWVGVAYLVFMGVSMIRHRGIALHLDTDAEPGTPGSTDDIRAPGDLPRALVHRAVLLNLLNPKLTVFFFAFLPAVPRQHAGPARSPAGRAGRRLHAHDLRGLRALRLGQRRRAGEGAGDAGRPPPGPADDGHPRDRLKPNACARLRSGTNTSRSDCAALVLLVCSPRLPTSSAIPTRSSH